MYYWQRDIHEHIVGGRDTMHFGSGEPHIMTYEDKEKMMELMDYAPWAQWGATANNVPMAELKMVVKPNSDAMHRVQECLDASKAVCTNMQNLFKQAQQDGILTSPHAGSLPSIMREAMEAMDDMEEKHMKPMSSLILSLIHI